MIERVRRTAARSSRRLRRWRSMPRGDRRLALESVLELTRASFRIGITRDDRLLGLLGSPSMPGDAARVSAAPSADTIQLGKMVERIARLLPWHPTCLRQALAARRLLRRRGIDHDVVLGVRDGRVDAAHAWVQVGPVVIVGERQRAGFTAVARYKWCVCELAWWSRRVTSVEGKASR